jgi:adenylate cyclase class 2
MTDSHQEIEVKLPLDGPAQGRRLLRQAGFRVVRRRIYEANVVLDTADQKLRKARSLLRVRQAGKRCTLTYKGPPLPGRHKSRQELETVVGNLDSALLIFQRLGFEPVFCYEKHRTEYRLAGQRGSAFLDETPAGTYLELEGPPAWIDRNARKLGFGPEDYITVSYARLHIQQCIRDGQTPGPRMVFARAARRGPLSTLVLHPRTFEQITLID